MTLVCFSSSDLGPGCSKIYNIIAISFGLLTYRFRCRMSVLLLWVGLRVSTTIEMVLFRKCSCFVSAYQSLKSRYIGLVFNNIVSCNWDTLDPGQSTEVPLWVVSSKRKMRFSSSEPYLPTFTLTLTLTEPYLPTPTLTTYYEYFFRTYLPFSRCD